MQVKKQQNWKRKNGVVQSWERSTSKLYSHPTYLTYMQSTSCEMLEWMKHKLESSLLGEISTTLDTQMTSL